MKPLVAIGVPVYNGDKHLAECLESIRNQTYENWECVVANNQSTDHTLSIAESFVKTDSRFRVVTNPEFVDMKTNFNNAHKYCNESKYFKVVCADDWIFPEYLEKMVDVLESNPRAGVCSSYRIDHKIVNCAGLDYYKGPVFDGKEVLKQQLLRQVDDLMGSETTLLIRTETLKKLSRYPVIYSHDDYHFDTSLAYEILNISDLGFVFQVLSYTRRSEGTFTSQYSERFHTNLNLREKELFKYKGLSAELEKEYKKERERYGYFLFKSRLLNDKECLEWHDKQIDQSRKFTLREQLVYAFRVNVRKII
ncbi:MAG: glycosyltransferase family 2 protein [Bacteroidales bacterium]